MHTLKKYIYKIVITIVIILLCIAMAKAISRAKETMQGAECYSNLKTLGVNLAMNADELAGELKGTYPPMSSEANRLMFTTEGFLPKYMPAPELLVCPCQVSKGIPQEFDDTSYFYTGYVLVERGFIPPDGWPFLGDMNYPINYLAFDNLMKDFSDFYNKQIASAGAFKERLVREGKMDIYRITEGVRHGYERTIDCVGDDIEEDVKISAVSIPVLVEWPDIHSSQNLGGHVLWLDGHVSRVKYPDEFPMTEEAMAIFTKLAGRPPIGQLD